jgi:hypothetical protein
MGLTLIEAAKYENRLEHLAVLRTFSEGELLARLPFMNTAASGLFYSAEQELPSVSFRAVNAGYSQSYGVVDQRAEAVHLFGGDVDVDRSIVDLMGPETCPPNWGNPRTHWRGLKPQYTNVPSLVLRRTAPQSHATRQRALWIGVGS